MLHYRDIGSGPCLLLIHGLFIDHRVWDRLVPLLTPRARCVMPDLPLGAHRMPMNGDADLSPPGLARLIAEFIRELRLRDVTVLGNDTGGALCQILCANHPELVDRLVLTNCDSFERFPPFPFRAIERIGTSVPGVIAGLDLFLRVGLLRRAALAAAPVTMRPLPDTLLGSWFEALHDRRIRADLRAVLRGISPEHTQTRDWKRSTTRVRSSRSTSRGVLPNSSQAELKCNGSGPRAPLGSVGRGWSRYPHSARRARAR